MIRLTWSLKAPPLPRRYRSGSGIDSLLRQQYRMPASGDSPGGRQPSRSTVLQYGRSGSRSVAVTIPYCHTGCLPNDMILPLRAAHYALIL
jgi:hypothetical protein